MPDENKETKTKSLWAAQLSAVATERIFGSVAHQQRLHQDCWLLMLRGHCTPQRIHPRLENQDRFLARVRIPPASHKSSDCHDHPPRFHRMLDQLMGVCNLIQWHNLGDV